MLQWKQKADWCGHLFNKRYSLWDHFWWSIHFIEQFVKFISSMRSFEKFIFFICLTNHFYGTCLQNHFKIKTYHFRDYKTIFGLEIKILRDHSPPPHKNNGTVLLLTPFLVWKCLPNQSNNSKSIGETIAGLFTTISYISTFILQINHTLH